MRTALATVLILALTVQGSLGIHPLHALNGWLELSNNAKDSTFGTHLLNVLELALKQKGKVDDAIRMLKDSITDIQKTQEDTRSANILEMANLMAQIKSDELDLENNKMWRETN